MSRAVIALDGLAKAQRMIESGEGSLAIQLSYLRLVRRALERSSMPVGIKLFGVVWPTKIGLEWERLRMKVKSQLVEDMKEQTQ